MVIVISEDSFFGENIQELFMLETNKEIHLFSSVDQLSSTPLSQVQLIIYYCSDDPSGDRLHCHLLANDPQGAIPVIFLSREENLDPAIADSPQYAHLQLPFETDRLLALSPPEVALGLPDSR